MNQVLQLIKDLFFVLCLICIAWEDWRHRKIPNRYITGLILWWAVSQATDWRRGLSAVAVAGLVFLVSILFHCLAGRRGLGAGDIKLYFAATLYLGFEKGLYLVLLSCVMALVYRIALGRKGKRSQPPFAFGPFIAAAAMILYSI